MKRYEVIQRVNGKESRHGMEHDAPTTNKPVRFEIVSNGNQFNLIAVFAGDSRATWGDSKTKAGASRMLTIWNKRYGFTR